LKAELEPYLGFNHSLDHGMPSLVCDFQEIYRFLIDDLVIKEAMILRKRDLVLKDEVVSAVRRGKREYLAKEKNSEFIKKLNALFTEKVNVPRIRHGDKQEVETLISEEALLFGMYLRGERPSWVPRVADLK
jgi:CRISPR/Cas system-associated endonuclease Cas1